MVVDKEDVIIGEKALITSLNETVDTDKELFIYKDDVISKQTDVISSLTNSHVCGDITNVEDNDGIRDTFNRSESSIESQGMNTLKDMELNDDTKEIQRLTFIAKSWRNDFENLKKKYKEVNARGHILEKRIEDQAMIISKADLAIQTKCELVNAKDEVINNLKTILDLRKADSPRENVVEVTAVPETLKHGIKECCEFMEVHATNGVVLNGGFLLWLDIQRQTTPENVWKVQAVKRFLKEEIADAKEILWRTVRDSIIDKKILRKGPTKMVSEVNDICTASLPPIIDNDMYISNFEKKADIFNEYFANECTINDNGSVLPSFVSKTTALLTHVSVTREQIISITNHLSPNKAHGYDGISISMLKLCAAEIATPLLIIFQDCINSGTFPDCWKYANVQPIHK